MPSFKQNAKSNPLKIEKSTLKLLANPIKTKLAYFFGVPYPILKQYVQCLQMPPDYHARHNSSPSLQLRTKPWCTSLFCAISTFSFIEAVPLAKACSKSGARHFSWAGTKAMPPRNSLEARFADSGTHNTGSLSGYNDYPSRQYTWGVSL